MTDEEIDKKFYDLAMEHRLGAAPEKFIIDGEEIALTIQLNSGQDFKFQPGGRGLACDFFIQGKFSATYTFPFLEYEALNRDVEYHLGPASGKQKSFFSSEPSNKIITISPPYTRDDLIHWLMIIELTKVRV